MLERGEIFADNAAFAAVSGASTHLSALLSMLAQGEDVAYLRSIYFKMEKIHGAEVAEKVLYVLVMVGNFICMSKPPSITDTQRADLLSYFVDRMDDSRTKKWLSGPLHFYLDRPLMCNCPPVSAVVALADKIDNLACFWSIDKKPTGSSDPFALRRDAFGVIQWAARLHQPAAMVYADA